MNKDRIILEELINNLYDGIHIIDEKGTTVYYNEAMANLEGTTRDEVLGKRITEYLDRLKEENSTLLSAIKNKKKYSEILQEYYNNNNKLITTINTSIPIFNGRKVIGAIEISKDMTQVKMLNEKVCKLEEKQRKSNKGYSFKDIIGNSTEMRNVVNKAMRASLSNSSVLIYGETGSGKEVLAQSIHYNGIRSDKPFIAVNCAAIPSPLLEGMFFGTVKGSFTGAIDKKGLFEEAHRGTLLLDELNSMDTQLQSKLLRVLQEGYIRPLGSNKTIDVDVRVIATLNENPEKLIKEGKLRKDLYYRLSVVKFDIPPLKDRKEDIEDLVNHFVQYYNKILGKEVIGVKNDVMERLINYEWPGNIRELKNAIESAMNLAEDYKKIGMEMFEDKFHIGEHEKIELNGISLDEYLGNVERSIIKDVLYRMSGNISKAADELKISRQSLQYKIKKYKLNNI
ncbi:sigma-54 interaction domain-containing protein [Oceanirhabdus sp. W0125-5]|uniref:sigma-54 interaction domain-containing protein n=1 Tax=Oceanirhabdus sp. W0125-5 TaxID=2999116 RepID=UPI0022F2A8C2|nr:sigma 54-interacting transcriptional regulator [Oceanirhabdus sp. W0125-5]WBW99564.1 sigma 54-interacting transcriptional regulator [Oceanirhabdus sp. W0125-5]